jgi:hypothetical protein
MAKHPWLNPLHAKVVPSSKGQKIKKNQVLGGVEKTVWWSKLPHPCRTRGASLSGFA